MVKVLIGIPTYNGAHRVDWLIQSIAMKTDKNIEYKIVICDDSGKKEHQEKTKSIINKWRDRVPIELIVNKKNVGVSSSWNRLTRSHNSRYVILINDDIIVAKDWLKNMIYFLENNPNVGAACYNPLIINECDMIKLISSPNATIIPRQAKTRIPIKNFDYDRDITPIRCMATIGSIIGFRRHMYDMVGGFDENYFAFYEETDFLTNLASHGYSNYLLRCPKIWHVYSATFSTSPEFNRTAIFERSKQYYIIKWGNQRDAHRRYMSRIPLQDVKWICKDVTYEKISTN